MSDRFGGLHSLAQVTGVSAENLLKVLDIEVQFHDRLLCEPDVERRADLCQQLYSAVHPLLSTEERTAEAAYTRIARLFADEFRNRTILDIGCGNGTLLRAIAAAQTARRLIGIDVSEYSTPGPYERLQQNVVSFRLPQPVDVIVSSQVIEHIPPQDVEEHLRCVWSALVPGGLFIVITPNRLWGPHDITRVYDFTNTNRLAAQGSHLNELTYGELIALLRNHGFKAIRTTLPFADRLGVLRRVRVKPVLNLLIERRRVLRELTYLLKWHGRAAFKNTIVLVATKP